MACTEVDGFINKFGTFVEKPVKFLTVQEDVKDDIKNLVKTLYDYTKSREKGKGKANKSALPELIVKECDEEQIWQELELQNSERWDQFVWDVANCISNKNDLLFPVKISEEEQSSENDESEAEASDNEEPQPENEKPQKKVKRKFNVTPKTSAKQSIVDDQFFKLKDMEKFLLKEEKGEKERKEVNSDEESIDMFEDIDDEDSKAEEGGRDMMYSDFFDRDVNEDNDQDYDDEGDEGDEDNEDDEDDEVEEESEKVQNKKQDKKVSFASIMDDEESDDSDNSKVAPEKGINDNTKDEKKSEFELRQQRLKERIEKLEEKNLKDAPWQLKGEVDGTKRPQNSLLQEVVDFDLTSRPPPIITEQTTITLEEIIRRRVKDKAWDDVEKKEKPVDDQLSFRKKEVIDQSKSKLSLAQVYEAEYLKQKQALSGENEEEKEPESHTQIRDTMSKLFSKLDALCHYHYTPKAPQAEVKIVTNTPAISMEEVAPVATSDATLLAPEEIKKKRRGDLMSKEERTQTDKNRERRKKKKLQRQKGKVAKVTDSRNTKKGIEANDKSLKTSKAFFQQLNDDATSLIKNKRNVKNKGQ